MPPFSGAPDLMLWLGIVLIAAGIALLWVSADPFVVAAVRLARIWGVSPVLVGALVIGFGTSAPEMLVSVLAAARGELASSIGNVVGSNAANLSLVLGVSAVISPVVGQLRILRREGVITLIAMAAVLLVAWDDTLLRVEGVGLMAAMAVAAVLLVVWSRRDMASGLAGVGLADIDLEADPDEERHRAGREIGRAVMSLVGIVFGASLLVEGGGRVAEVYGLSGGFVGATIFALGTSLPELVTAGAAARRKANELVIGNLLGSNLFNSFLVVGLAGVVGAGAIGERRVWEHVMMMVIGLLVGILAVTRRRLGRIQGLILLAAFVMFILVVSQQAAIPQ